MKQIQFIYLKKNKNKLLLTFIKLVRIEICKQMNYFYSEYEFIRLILEKINLYYVRKID